ncbi:STAS domain-containing protein [Allosalinactinospora lopnorensis]|uniref:STAS domain-containing protein n=1 Tax=Allosalinactinospora lopnorensis TaxID=1352348 RepID=UPI00138F4FDD|nr:STAS domain-containing protein [Allosalinactinospora lopnorensis]
MQLSTLTRHDNAVIVEVRGEADLATSPDLIIGLQAVDAPPGGVVFLELSLLDFCDASGLNALVAAARLLRERGVELALVGPQPHMSRLLEITGLDAYFDVFPLLAAVDLHHLGEDNSGRPRMACSCRQEVNRDDGYARGTER